MVASHNYRPSFGAQYSEEVVEGLTTLSDRVFAITAKKRKKYKAFKADLESRFDADAKIDTSHWDDYVEKYHKDCYRLAELGDSYKFFKKNLRQGLERIDMVMPENTLYPYVSPKGRAYFAIDINGVRKLIAPMRTWQGQNPIENPKSMRISLNELKKIASKLERLETIENVKYYLKKTFHF